MEKNICDICGSEFPESLAQCPVCGCAKKVPAVSEPEATPGSGYIKGGRFSKANVRRRMSAGTTPVRSSEAVKEYVKKNDDRYAERKPERSKPAPVEDDPDDMPKSNTPLLLIVILLLIAVIAVSVYIVISFSAPSGPNTNQTTTQKPVLDDGPCTAVQFSETEIVMTKLGEIKLLTVSTVPANTLDSLRFYSSDDSIVSVDNKGNLVANAEGTAIITVKCGGASASISVKCRFNDSTTKPTTKPTTQPTTKPTEPTTGDFIIPSGAKELGPFTVKVTASDANVRKGPGTNYDKVTKVTTGDTLTVTMEYDSGDYVWALSDKGWIVKSFLKFPAVSDDWPYQMKIDGKDPRYGDSSRAEVTLGVDSTIRLEIVDADGKPVTVSWNVDKPNCCTMVGNQVRRNAKGTTTLTATHEGYTFVLIIS